MRKFPSPAAPPTPERGPPLRARPSVSPSHRPGPASRPARGPAPGPRQVPAGPGPEQARGGRPRDPASIAHPPARPPRRSHGRGPRGSGARPRRAAGKLPAAPGARAAGPGGHLRRRLPGPAAGRARPGRSLAPLSSCGPAGASPGPARPQPLRRLRGSGPSGAALFPGAEPLPAKGFSEPHARTPVGPAALALHSPAPSAATSFLPLPWTRPESPGVRCRRAWLATLFLGASRMIPRSLHSSILPRSFSLPSAGTFLLPFFPQRQGK